MKPDQAIKKIAHIADKDKGSLDAFLYLSGLANKDKVTIPKKRNKGCNYNSWDDTYEVFVGAICPNCSNEITRFTLTNNKEDGFMAHMAMPKEPLFCPFCGQAVDMTGFKRLLTKAFYETQKKNYINKINKRINRGQKQ